MTKVKITTKCCIEVHIMVGSLFYKRFGTEDVTKTSKWPSRKPRHRDRRFPPGHTRCNEENIPVANLGCQCNEKYLAREALDAADIAKF